MDTARPLYTSDIPVLTPELLAEFENTARLPERMTKIRISESPMVLGQIDASLRIWRQDQQGLPPQVQAFVATAIRLFGIAAGADLQELFRQQLFSLDENGALQSNREGGSPQEFTTSMIIAKYESCAHKHNIPPIDPSLSLAFSSYIVDSLKKVLESMQPIGATGLLTDNESKCIYSHAATPSEDSHSDGFSHVLMHLTDPGTPYGKGLFRTAAGDITYHKGDVIHGFATVPLTPEGKDVRRMCLGFKVRGKSF